MSQRTTLKPDTNRRRSSNGARGFMAGFLGCGGLLAVVALLAGGIYLFYTLAPVEAQLPNNAVPIIVNLTRPFHADNLSLTDYSTVQADAIGDTPIQLMQLWADGLAVDAHAANLNGAFYSTEFSWRPDVPGDHLLMVIAVDTSGNSAISNLVQVKAFPPEPQLLSLPVVEGDTVQSVASALDMTPDQVIALNPQITTPLDQPLPPGTTLTVLPPSSAPAVKDAVPPIPPDTSLLPPPPQPPAGPVSPAPALPTNNPIGLFTELVVIPQVNAPARPAAPQLATDVEGCTVNLYFFDASNNETGFLVYRAKPGSTNFEQIASLAPNSKADATLSYTEQGRYGRTMYYISAFNGAGETQSNPASATIDSQACVQPDQVGLAVQRPKVTTAQPVGKAFCYAGIDNGPWVRMPKAEGQHVYPVNGVFDFSNELNTLISPPPTVPILLSMRCGGFVGDTLIDLGVGSQTIQPNSNNQPFQLTGEGFTLTATLNFGQTQVPPPQVARVLPPPSDKIIAPTFDVVVIPDPDTGELNLLWRWKPVTCPPGADGQPPADCQYITDITGYRVYDQKHVVVKDGLTPDQKLLKLPPLTADREFVCFTVVAYKDAIESRQYPACAGNSNLPTRPLPSANIAAPTNLRVTNDLKDCQSHRVAQPVNWGDPCEKLTGDLSLALVWDWSNYLCRPGEPGCQAIADIDGYRLYLEYYGTDVSTGSSTPVNDKAFVLTYPSRAAAYCYVVRAYKGNLESGSSNKVCSSPVDLGRANFSLEPSAGYQFGSTYTGTTCDPITSKQVDTPDTGSFYPGAKFDFNVGYVHRSTTGVDNADPTCPQVTSFWREGMVGFDLSQLVGRTIQKATFEFKRGQAQELYDSSLTLSAGFVDAGLGTDNDCATGLNTNIGVYRAGTYVNGQLVKEGVSGMYSGSVFAAAPLGTAPLDVTTLANNVAQSNNKVLSFIFATDQSHPPETASCFSRYHNFLLNIELAP